MIILNGDLFTLMEVDETSEMKKVFLDESLVQINILWVIWKRIKDRIKENLLTYLQLLLASS